MWSFRTRRHKSLDRDHKRQHGKALRLQAPFRTYAAFSCHLLADFAITAGVISASLPAFCEQRMISVGDCRVAVYGDGQSKGSPTVILIPAGGRTAKDWAPIQPAVSSFARVCSYDHANQGASDKAPVPLQSVDEVVDDLRAWLTAAAEQGPFLLVAHSSSGFYARRFSTRYPRDVAGFVLVDSAHEEQATRLHQLDPEGPKPDDVAARIGFYVKPGEQLQWRTERPLIVLARGTPFERVARDQSNSQTNRMTEEQFAA